MIRCLIHHGAKKMKAPIGPSGKLLCLNNNKRYFLNDTSFLNFNPCMSNMPKRDTNHCTMPSHCSMRLPFGQQRHIFFITKCKYELLVSKIIQIWGEACRLLLSCLLPSPAADSKMNEPHQGTLSLILFQSLLNQWICLPKPRTIMNIYKMSRASTYHYRADLPR